MSISTGWSRRNALGAVVGVGSQGPQGIQGPTGPTGPQGPQGITQMLCACGWWYFSSPQADYSNRYFGSTSYGTYFDNGPALAGAAMVGPDGIMYCRQTGTYHISMAVMDNHGSVSGNYAGARLVKNGVDRYIIAGAHTAASADTDTLPGSHGGASMILPLNNGDYMRLEMWSSNGYPLYFSQTWIKLPT